jgi:hypothetical protein
VRASSTLALAEETKDIAEAETVAEEASSLKRAASIGAISGSAFDVKKISPEKPSNTSDAGKVIEVVSENSRP